MIKITVDFFNLNELTPSQWSFLEQIVDNKKGFVVVFDTKNLDEFDEGFSEIYFDPHSKNSYPIITADKLKRIRDKKTQEIMEEAKIYYNLKVRERQLLDRKERIRQEFVKNL